MTLHRPRLVRLGALLLMLGTLAGAANAANVKMYLRYDDFTGYSDAKIEKALFDAAERLGGSVLVSVIPFPRRNCVSLASQRLSMPIMVGERKRALLKEYADKGVVRVAAHGCNHRSISGDRYSSEFAGLKGRYQKRLLDFVKRSIEASIGVPVTTFVPPFNAYDAGTLSALQETGFSLLSAGIIGPTDNAPDIKFLPGGTYPANLRKTVGQILKRGIEDAILPISIHPYDIKESGGKLPQFRKRSGQVDLQQFLDDIAWASRQPGIELATLDQLIEHEDLSGARQQAQLDLLRSVVTRHRLLPKALEIFPVHGVYHSRAEATGILFQQRLRTVLFYSAILLLATLLAFAVLRMLSTRIPHLRWIALTAALAGLGALWYKASISIIYMNAAIAIALCVALLVASLLPFRRRPARP